MDRQKQKKTKILGNSIHPAKILNAANSMLNVVSSLELTVVHATLAYSDLRPNVNSSNYVVVLVFANVGFRVAGVKTNFGFIIWCYFPSRHFLYGPRISFFQSSSNEGNPHCFKRSRGIKVTPKYLILSSALEAVEGIGGR